MAVRRRLSDARVARAIDERDDKNGARKAGAIDYAALGEVASFRPKAENSYKLNIIPYEIKNPKNPIVLSGQLQVGDLDMWLEVRTHRNIGPDGAFVICPSKMYGTRCPICERKQALYDAGSDSAAQQYNPSKRLIMYVQVFDKGEPQPIQLFEVAHYSFGQPLLSKADRLRKAGKIKNFADPDEGNLIKFYAEKGQRKGWVDFEDFEFLDREEEILDEDLENKSLDEFLIVYTADELQVLLDQTRERADDEDDDDRRDRDERGSRRGRDDDRGSRRDRDDRDEGDRGSRRDRDDDRGSRRDRDDDRGSRRDRDDDRGSSRSRDRDDGRGDRNEDRGSSRRDDHEEGRAHGQDHDESPSPSEAAPRTRPVEKPAAIPQDDRCPSRHGWGPEAVDKFPECAACSKWSECLEGK